MPDAPPAAPARRAVITGASSGIGAAFARLLSGQGYDLVLVGRDRERLEAVAAEVPGPARAVGADLTQESDLAAVETLLADPAAPVDLLVNNAGAARYGPVLDHDPQILRDTVALNATALIRLSRAVLPAMVSRGSGGLVNVSSVAGSAPSANMATYAATKAFVDSWSASLVRELRGTGVVVTCVKPGYVRSEFHARSGEELGHVPDTEWLSPAAVAQRALGAHVEGRASVVVLPPLPPVRRLRRWGISWVLRHAPWVRDVKRALTSRAPRT